MPKLPSLPNMGFFSKLPRFGEYLRDYRTLRGIAVEQLAAAVGIAPSALRAIEEGTRPAPPKNIITALANALQLSKEEHEALTDAADMDSPFMHAVLGRRPPKTDRPTMPAAILAFLIADIRGYTHYTQEYGDEAAARLTQRFAELARAVLERWDGQLVEVRGDEVLGVFASARQALRAAHDLQAGYAELSREDADLPAGIGVGLDIGEAVPVDGGYRGTTLNRAARLCSLASAGEVLVSTGVLYVAPQVEGVTYVARGQQQLKGFDAPVPILLAAPSVATVPGDVVETGTGEPEE